MTNSKTPTVQTKPARWLNPRMLLIASMLALAACGGEGSGSISRLKAAIGGTVQAPTTQPTPQAETQTQSVEVTRIVDVPQPAQVVEATRIIEVPATVVVVVTATPDVQGFSEPAIDESAQPCPAKYWRNGRCNATQAQLEQAARQVQP